MTDGQPGTRVAAEGTGPDEGSRVLHVTLAAEGHSIDSLQRTAYRFTDRAAVDLARQDDMFLCSLWPHTRLSGEAEDTLVREFKIEALDQALRERIRAQTEPFRNVILALAFSQTDLHDSDG